MADVEKATHDDKMERIETQHSSPSQKKLAQMDTLERVDIHNPYAWKGDESDGKFSWHWRQWCAAAFLAMLYTGTRILVSTLRSMG